MIEIKIPSPGESITEVEISNWLVENGDYVEKDQEIAEIESDKATLPLIAPESGKIEIIVSSGETIRVGEIACKIDINAKISNSKIKKQNPEEVKDIDSQEIELGENEKVRISPIAAKLISDNNIDIKDLFNKSKRIGKKEVEDVIAKKSKEAYGTFQDEESTDSRSIERKKMSQLRKKISERLVSVKNETAMLTTFNEVDMTEIMAIRKKYQEQFTEKYGTKLGYMSFFTKAVTIALNEFPAINSQIDGNEIIYPGYADIGIAVQTPKGLMVPVVRNAENMTFGELEIKIKELADKGRAGRISIDDLKGGTFTITNGGVFGSMLSTPILNPPQSGILGMHNIMERPVAINGKVEIRPMMYLALSYDHRTIDGKDSVGFLVKVKELLEAPYDELFNNKNADEI